MTVHYKEIVHERTEDAPFIGAVICAANCKKNCKGCFNQWLKNLPTLSNTTSEVIEMVLANPFNQGIILAGLEWTYQKEEAISLSQEAHRKGLYTMMYTGNDYVNLIDYKDFDYLKVGAYKEDLAYRHTEYGVVLATSNQHIYKKGVDY